MIAFYFQLIVAFLISQASNGFILPSYKFTDEKYKPKISAEINDIKPKVIELRKTNEKYYKDITKRIEGIQNNPNNFNKDIQKDDSRSM